MLKKTLKIIIHNWYILELVFVVFITLKMLLVESVSWIDLLPTITCIWHQNQLQNALSIGHVLLPLRIAHGFEWLNLPLRIHRVLNSLHVTINRLLSYYQRGSKIILLLSIPNHLSLVVVVIEPVLVVSKQLCILLLLILERGKERMLQGIFGTDSSVWIAVTESY